MFCTMSHPILQFHYSLCGFSISITIKTESFVANSCGKTIRFVFMLSRNCYN